MRSVYLTYDVKLKQYLKNNGECLNKHYTTK